MRTALRINVMAVEYPGYGIYENQVGPSEEQIYHDAALVYNFVQGVTELTQEDIIVMGRSLGSGPAVHIASNY